MATTLGTRARAALGVAVTAAVSGAALYAPPHAFAASANDNFANATAVSDGYAYGSNVGATREAGEPVHAGVTGEASIWYTWTASYDAKVSLRSYLYDADTGDYSTHALAVYTGHSVSSLTPVVSNSGTYGNSTSFVATAGRTYKFAIDSTLAKSGSTELYLSAVPKNDPFGSPKVISGSSGSLTGSNVNATKQSSEPYHAGSYGGSSVWYSWTASTTGATKFETTGSNFDTLLAVYTGVTLSGLSAVASNDDCAGSDIGTSCLDFNAVAGTTYKIAVDGYNYTQGSIKLQLGTPPGCDITGTEGADVLTGTSADESICGLGGDDVIKGQGGNDTIVGGDGVDIVSYLDATTGVIANLTTGTATGQGTDTLQGIESITGSAHNDKLDGDAGANALRGVGGSDGVWGQAGNDQVYGGDGVDTVGPGIGDDTADGGIGADTAHFAKAVAVSVDLTTGSASGEGTDTLAAFENVTGSAGADTLRGGTGVNSFQGGGGNDTLLGFGGNDKLYGAAGNDSLTGGDGSDRCDGGTGTDTGTTCETRVAIP